MLTHSSIVTESESLPSGRSGTSRAASSDNSRAIGADIMRAARRVVTGVVGDTGVADGLCRAAADEGDARTRGHAGIPGNDKACTVGRLVASRRKRG